MKTRIIIIPILFCGLLLGCLGKQPTRLSGKTETIEVYYINWASNAADFIETKYTLDSPQAEDLCIFIEPADSSLYLPESFYVKDHFDHNLRLTGQFYEDEGVPDSYVPKTSESTEKAKVFRYTHWELVAN